jgi:4-methyl-5(b-hydroxyethyl)-thiazole monophosphate biosynthesis
MAKKVLVLLAEGFEEVEAVSPIDYLRRAGIEVKTVSVSGERGAPVTGSHGIPVLPDLVLEDINAAGWDGVLLPGGMPGAAHLAASAGAAALVKAMAAGGKLICAICASPALVLAPWGLLEDRRFTCFPGMEQQAAQAAPEARWSEDPVVRDGSVITSRGAGTAAAWSLKIIETLLGLEAAQKIAAAVLLKTA